MVVSHHGADFLDFLALITAIGIMVMRTGSRWICDSMLLADVIHRDGLAQLPCDAVVPLVMSTIVVTTLARRD
jgi:hypothetical protein